jgi:hypothetical protein
VTTTTVTCDRCRQVIATDRHHLTVTSGPGRRLLPDGADLCPRCMTALLAWLAQPDPAPATPAGPQDLATR